MKGFLGRHKADIIVLVSFILVGLSVFLITLLLSPDGEYARISVDGETVAYLSLNDDAEYPVANGKNTVVVENGRVYMREAACPDRLCVNMGKIHSVGERIVCLPNRVIVEVVDGRGS